MMLFTLFATFFKIGLFTFGGGYAMLPLIQEEVVSRGWFTMEEMINFVAVSESTPGPFAINTATLIGTRTEGIIGGICATLGVALPSFIIILIVAKFFERFKTSKIINSCMSGLKPAVIGLIGSAVISMGKTVFFPMGINTAVFCDINLYISLAIFGVMTYLSFKKVHPILIICLSAIIGVVVGYLV